MLFGQYKFQFVRGECRVTPSKIYLPCDGADRFIQDTTPAEMKRYTLIAGIGGLILFSYAAFLAYNSGHWILAFFAFAVCVSAGFEIIQLGKDFPRLCEISKDEVTSISVSKGDDMNPRPCITIHVTKDGRERVAYLVFSYKGHGGEEEVAKALEVFSDQHWEVESEECEPAQAYRSREE